MQKNQVRIIAGKYRGCKIHFPDQQGLRPTGDRIRETLFNWLQGDIAGSRCLDLFAGSGALGFEAASRGAGYVLMIESAGPVVYALQENKCSLAVDHVDVIQHLFPNPLPLDDQGKSQQPFDIIFLDPPFRHGLIDHCVGYLEQHLLLAPNAKIYIEAEKDQQLNLPEHWTMLKEKSAGNVKFYLFSI